MSNATIKKIIDQAINDSTTPSIGLSGGEAFYHFDDLIEISSYATQKGARIAINTNCFWATDTSEAVRIVRLVKGAGVAKLVASTDAFHNKYIPEACVINAIEACVEEHLEIEIQFVATKKSGRLHEFLSRNVDRLLNITAREIPMHPVGRSIGASGAVLLTQDKIPTGKCPNAVLSVSADGRYIPCCNSAGHLPAMELGRIDEALLDVNERFLTSPVMSYLWRVGPSGLLPIAEKSGFKRSVVGYVDQCHLCHDLFQSERVAKSLMDFASNWMFDCIYENYKSSLTLAHSTCGVTSLPEVTRA